MAVIDTEPFVLLVKENDLLYNKNRTDYKDHEKKMKCWNNIAKLYNVPVNVVLAKWKSLREKYIKERKQVKLHGISALKWEHHHLFKFLDPFILPRNRSSAKYPHIEVSVTPSAILADDSSSIAGDLDPDDFDPKILSVSGSSSVVDDYTYQPTIHSSSSMHHVASDYVAVEQVASTSSRDYRLGGGGPSGGGGGGGLGLGGQKRVLGGADGSDIYVQHNMGGVSNFTYMLQAKAERIKETCELLTEDELFGCEVIEELRRKRSKRIKREIKMKILGIFNDYDGIGED